MKTEIEIVTGFLGAGKTSFTNSLIKESYVDGEKIIVIQLENGQSNIDKSIINENLVEVVYLNHLNELEDRMLILIKENLPNRIIIEFNGTFNIEDLFKIMNERVYRECIRVETIYFIGDSKNLELYIKNMGNFLVPFIEYSNILVLNNIENCNTKERENILKIVNELNPSAFILEVKNKYLFNSSLIENKVLNNNIFKKIKIKLGRSNNILRRKKSE
ncbi:GTP-binding protein [Clostridium weizhouense]|uniref:Cobalamin biosynthesis protein n=1 Tax=Clostridium weizhouense TaxID=2859781 RepID=A0ABS7ANB9_9CLOT|nr:GTP-binding protein [Clostridium weizhouense]MBW6410148.1 cobalamin biosynthesis protein [Clostridium weizhouense]